MMMELKKERLGNGVMFVSAPNQHLHSANIGFYFHCGSVFESTRNNGISHLLEHLFFRRSSDLSQSELYRSVNRIGGILRGATYANLVRFDISVSAKYFRSAFEIIERVLHDFSWTLEELTHEKGVVKKQIAFAGSQPLWRRAERVYFNGTKNWIPIAGTEKTVSRTDLKAVHRWKHRFFHCANLCCVLTGNFSQQEEQYVRSRLAAGVPSCSCPKTPDIRPKCFGKRTSRSDMILFSCDDLSEMILSFDVASCGINEHQTALLSSMLTAADSSLLSQAARKNPVLIRGLEGWVSEYPGLRKIDIRVETPNNRISEAFDFLGKVLIECKTGLTMHDYQSAVLSATVDQMQVLDNVRALNWQLGSNIFLLHNEADPERIVAAYDKLTLSELQTTTIRVIRSTNLSVTVVNNSEIFPKKELRRKLNDLRKTLG